MTPGINPFLYILLLKFWFHVLPTWLDLPSNEDLDDAESRAREEGHNPDEVVKVFIQFTADNVRSINRMRDEVRKYLPDDGSKLFEGLE